MKKLLLPLLLCIPPLAAQTSSLLTVSGPSNIKAGSTVTLNISLNVQPSGTSIAALQFTLALPGAGYATGVTPSIGAAGSSSSKQITCANDATASNQTCVIWGMNANAISSGLVAVYSVPVPASASGTLTFDLKELVAASPAGGSVPLGDGSPFALTVIDKRDLNSDGAVNSTDVSLMVSEVTSSSFNPAACKDDQNADGKCDVLDVLAVLLKALGLVP